MDVEVMKVESARGQLLLLRVSEAARLLSVSRAKAYEMIAAGELPSVRIGGKCIRVPARALEEWVEAQLDHPVDVTDIPPAA